MDLISIGWKQLLDDRPRQCVCMNKIYPMALVASKVEHDMWAGRVKNLKKD